MYLYVKAALRSDSCKFKNRRVRLFAILNQIFFSCGLSVDSSSKGIMTFT